MTQYNVTQWNCCRQNEYDETYLKTKLDTADICVMQRCQDKFLSIAKDKFKFVFHEKHSEDCSLVIASNIEFTQPTKHKLPSDQLSFHTLDANQGSLALSVYFDGLQLINFQSIYECQYDHVTVTPQHAFDDLRYVFKNVLKNKKCVLLGDIHEEPEPPSNIKSLIKETNLVSHTDQLMTFGRMDEENNVRGCRHDRIFTLGNINTSDLQSYAKPQDGNGHWIITYTMHND